MPKNGHDQPTRHRILSLLKTLGPRDARTLGESLGITAMAARQHLYELHARGLVSFTESPRPVGRPAKLWQLTAAADAFFPDGHAELAVDLLAAMRQTFGADGMDQFIAARAKTQVADYRRTVRPGASLRQRLAALAKLRTAEGYMASVQTEGRGRYVFVENHCPICTAAAACTGICAAELDVFRQTLGPDVTVERTDHILAGARRCAYAVHKRQRP